MTLVDFICYLFLVFWFHASAWLIRVFFIAALANGAGKKIKKMGGDFEKWAKSNEGTSL